MLVQYTLLQSKYIIDFFLHKTAMFDSKPVVTPSTIGKNLSKFDGDLMEDVTMYRSITRAL